METINKYPKVYTLIGFGLIASIIFLGLGLFFSQPNSAQGSAPSGLAATVATSSTITTSASADVVAFATSTNCASRTIGTRAKGISIMFNGNPPTTGVGFWQAASTTVTYDGALFGCGGVKVLSSDVADTITVQELR